ncbi:protealysin inhibitor emfourin [Streptomyces sp. NPDC059740]|uniref:protealysin inhibitor emfourin n=1 Tax=Streptomyces sp. NPDC059740 TaxID=3346926 RepID=UPI0036640648
MRIEVRRSGGFAGISRKAEVDTEERSDAAEWHALADRALADGEDNPPDGVPDGYSYALRVDERTVYFADPRLTGDQRDLVGRVLKEGS